MRTLTRRLAATGVASVTTAALAAVLLPAFGGTADPSATSPAEHRFLKAQVFTVPGTGAVAVGMPNPRTVVVQRRLEGEVSWSTPTLLFRRSGVTCGDIDGRASAGGVALTLHCDTPYYEDQAPVHSQAAVTQDLETWSVAQLPGEAYRPPGLSPSGEHAAWLTGDHGQLVSWTPGEGFSRVRSTTYDDDSGDPGIVVADDGTVTVAGPDHLRRRCVLGLHALDPAGTTSAQHVDLAPGVSVGCTEMAVEGVSSTRVTSSRYAGRPGRWVVGRADEASPWVLLARAPENAPGLQIYRGSYERRMELVFSDAAGQPLRALGSRDRRRVRVQTYDDAAQAWGPARTVYDHGFPGCTWGGGAGYGSRAVHSLLMHCYPKRRSDGDYPARTRDYDAAPTRSRRALLSADGAHWRTIPVGARPVVPSLDRQQVAAPGRKATTIVSPSGFARLPAAAPGRCEAVLPVGPRSLLRLDARRGSRGFPTRLQRWTGTRWRTVQRVKQIGPGRCRGVHHPSYGRPGRLYFDSPQRSRGLRLQRTDAGYRVRLTRGY